ncbi:hypothetical protein L2E82_12246 [Cichorium intybus]|uniref:Uncharacterized protein n=1 Tax=Cichorium intybus TaxID=13427 RepID=A0ACB9GFK1_CICIN|nr:hypothetical protein L2E82_12246 [Cichorium intybus]
MGANWVGVRSVYLLLGLILGALRSCNGGTTKTSLFYSTMSFLIDKSRNIKIRRLWIDAAGKVPDPKTIKAMEYFEKIYALDGVTDLKFPQHYPFSRLLGDDFNLFCCVEVVGCVTSEELGSWVDIPQRVG